jgi:hypothetical protein
MTLSADGELAADEGGRARTHPCPIELLYREAGAVTGNRADKVRHRDGKDSAVVARCSRRSRVGQFNRPENVDSILFPLIAQRRGSGRGDGELRSLTGFDGLGARLGGNGRRQIHL